LKKIEKLKIRWKEVNLGKPVSWEREDLLKRVFSLVIGFHRKPT